MYRSPLLLFYFLRNRIAMFSRHLIAACGFTTFIGTLFCLPLAAISQTSVLQTSGLQASDSPAVSFRGSDSGLSVRNPAIIGQPVQLSEAVRRSLSEQPAMQAGRARTCQALYRLGLNRAEARPQNSGSISGQRQLFGHYKVSNNTDKDSAEARGVSDRKLNVYDIEVSLRHKLWDWHVTDNRIRSEQLSHEAEQLNLDLNLSEQLLQLLTLSIRIHLFTEVVHLNHQTVQDLTPHIEAIEAQTRLAQARSRKASFAGQVAYAEIRAPQDGTVSALHLKTVGAVVQAGSVLAEIVPEEQGLTIRANLRPENVADVYLGQEARISLSAYDVSRYGSLAGVVKNVASNTTEREGQPPFYETIITVPDPVFTKTGQSAEIIPGMTVVVDTIGGKRTVLDYILTPINKATSVAFREN